MPEIRKPSTAGLIAALATACLRAGAADWPTYRADSARSGYTAEALPEKLTLLWTHRAPHKPQPAWPDQFWQRMTFDFAHQPVVAGGALYYGGSVDCTVHAIDAATGRRRWSFCTDGPVRFAPAVWRDRVFAVSDDGHLYCLACGDGKLLWKLRGGCSDRKMLGNGRVISMFPARGGPVVHGDVVYFGAGVFPTQGFFLHAVDAETGRILWTNDTSGNTRLYQYNHGFTYSNVAAQGYLAVAGDVLLVSTGRSVPAAFRRSDGKFLYYHPLEAYRSGGAWMMAADGCVYNGDMAFRVRTGEVVCPEMGADPDEGLGSNQSPFLRELRMIEAAAMPDLILIASGKAVRALDRGQPFVDDPKVLAKWATSRTAAFFAGSPRRRLSRKLQGANVVWTAAMRCCGAFIAAGRRAYAGGAGAVRAMDLKTRNIVWTAKVVGTACGLAAANGRLYASTDEGLIYCFGAGQAGGKAEVITPAGNERPYRDSDLHAAAADEIVRKTGVTEGYCLDIGCGDGRLAYHLARRTKLHIYAVDADASNVAAARAALADAGLYGSRVTVHHLPPARTGYPAHFANLIVSARSVTAGPDDVPKAEVRRLQRPCGGAVCLGRPGAMRLDRRGPLPGAGEWTHQTGSAANTCSSSDTVAAGPLAVLWFGTSGPGGMVSSKARPAAPLYADGRLYVAGQTFLRCLDAYNGRVMWEKRLPHRRSRECYMGANLLGSHYCATDREVYFVDDSKGVCLRLDGRTGRELARFRPPAAPDGKRSPWGYVAHADGVLYGTLDSAPFDAGYSHYLGPLAEAREVVAGRYTEGRLLFAMDAETGKVRWTYQPEHLIPSNGIAAGGGRVYVIDRPNVSVKVAEMRRRGAASPVSTSAGALVALDARTGEVLWRHREDVFGTLLALSAEHDALVMGLPIMRRGNLLSDLFTRLAAHRASDGKRLWERRVQYHQRPIVVGRTVIVDPGGFDWKTGRKQLAFDVPCAFDLMTGEPKTRANPVSGERDFWTFGRSEKCSGWTASPNLLLFRTGTISYYDFRTDEGASDVGGIRPGCFINVFAAGGLVLAPDNFTGCTCNYIHRTSIALQPVPQEEHWALFMGQSPRPGVIGHLALNVGAIGDRRDARGVLWLAAPRPDMQRTRGVKVDVRALAFSDQTIKVEFPGLKPPDPRDRPPLTWPSSYSDVYRPESLYRVNADSHPVSGTDIPWVYTSGNRGAIRISVNVSRMPPGTKYKVRLHFAEPANLRPQERIFDVSVCGKPALKGLDVLKEAGKPAAALVREVTISADNGTIDIALLPRKAQPIISGVEIIPATR